MHRRVMTTQPATREERWLDSMTAKGRGCPANTVGSFLEGREDPGTRLRVLGRTSTEKDRRNKKDI